MPPGSGVIVEGTGNTKRENPNLEKMDQAVDIKVQIIFSSISYTKFLKQKNKSTKFITNKKGGNVSDYYLYCAEDWPAETYNYNDPADQVIFIDCGSDDFGTATKNSKDEKVLRKYTSFAIMRLKDMLYRRSKIQHQRGQVHCMILAISPFQKCMMAMSALLGKVLSDSGIYFSFIADVGSRPEYRYTFNWIRSYGWKFEVYYNAVFRPFYARVECHNSPQLKLDEINKLINAETRYNTSWGVLGRKDVSNAMWGPKYTKDDDGNVTHRGAKAKGNKRKVTFYNKKEKKTKVYKEEEEVTLTEWEPQEESTEVWVPSDPKVQKWQDPVSGKYLVKYNGQIYERDYLQDFYEHSAHPNDDELTNRIGETHKAYDDAVQREKETKERVAATREARDNEFTQEYINKEVDNLVSKTGMSPEDAKAALAEQGFILQDLEEKDMYFHDGRMMSDEQLEELEKAAEDATKKAEQDYNDALKAKEIKDRNDYLFWLNMASLVVGVLSFGATSLALAAAFAIVDLGINAGVVYNQVQLATMDGGEWHDAFGKSTLEKGLNMGLTGLAVIGDVLAFVPVFKAIKSPRALPHTNVQAPPVQQPKIKQPSADLPPVKPNSPEVPTANSKPAGPQKTPEAPEPPKAPSEKEPSTPKTNSFHEFIDEASTEFDNFFDSKANYSEITHLDDKGNIASIEHFDSNGNTVYSEKLIEPKDANTIFDSKPTQPKPNSQIEIKGVDVNTGISLNGEKIHEHVFEVTDKSPISSPEATVKGQQQPSGAKTEAPSAEPQPAAKDANNSSPSNTETTQTGSNTTDGSGGTNTTNDANTEIVNADESIAEVVAEGNGTPSSNTGNGEKTVQEVKRSIWADAKEYFNEGMHYESGDSHWQRIKKAIKENTGWNTGVTIRNEGWKKIDLISLGSVAIHWICVIVGIKNVVGSFLEEPDNIDIGDSIIDQTVIDDGYSNVAQNNNGEIGNLVGVDPKSLDAEAIANHSQEVLDSLKDYESIDDANLDYEEMNAAANNVIDANNKLEYVESSKEMTAIIKQKEEEGLSEDEALNAAFSDDKYLDAYNRNVAASNKIDPNSDDLIILDEDKDVDIARAELEGAQVDLLLQQVIQKDKDNKLNNNE